MEIMIHVMIQIIIQEIQMVIMLASIPLEELQDCLGLLAVLRKIHLEEILEEIHLEEAFLFQGEIHLQVIIPVMDMLPGDTQDFQTLVSQETQEMGVLQEEAQGQVWVQEV